MTSYQAPPDNPPTAEDRRATAEKFRFGLPASLALSLVVHGIALLATQSARLAALPPGQAPLPLEATFVKPQAPPAPSPPTAPSDLPRVPADTALVETVPAAAATDHTESLDEGPISAPRLIGQPDFSEIEKSRVRMPIRVVLQIEVSPLGLAEAVTVMEADPLPATTLESVRQAFLKARYTPARGPRGKLAGAIEITVNLQPLGPFAPLPTETIRR